MIEPQVKTIKNHPLAYYEINPHCETTIVFVHGNSLNSSTFEKQQNLSKNHRLVFMDLPGHGNSSHSKTPNTTYTVNGYVEVISEFVNQLEANEVILVGHSLGGHLALNTASKVKNLKGLVSMGAPFLGIPPQMERAFHPHPAMALAFQGELTPEQCTELATAFWGSETLPEWVIESISKTDGQARSLLAKSMAEGDMNDELKLLEELKVPIAIFHGFSDNLIQRDYFNQISIPTLWNNQVYDLEGGHCFFHEKPEVYNAMLNSFMAAMV